MSNASIKFLYGIFTACLVFLSALTVAGAPGDPDPTFGSGGKRLASTGFSPEIYATVVQPDSKIVAVGYQEKPEAYGLVARFNSDGTFDETFGDHGVVTDARHGIHHTYFMAVALQPDGKIIASGHFLESGGCGPYRAFVLRLNSDGTRDSTFNGPQGVQEIIYECPNQATSFANSIAIQLDGKILLAGSARMQAGLSTSMDFAVTRFNSNGSFDTSFSGDGMATFSIGNDDEEAFGITVYPTSGKIALGGYTINTAGNRDFAVMMLLPNGAPDIGFGFFSVVQTNFAGMTDQISSLRLQPDGKLLAGGVATTTGAFGSLDAKFALARYNTNGSLDATFGTSGKVTTNFTILADSANAIALQADGKIVAAGTTVSIDGTQSNFAVSRYLSNGAIDTSFSGDGKLTTDFLGGADYGRGLAIQADGKILVAGYAASENSTHIAMARYLP